MKWAILCTGWGRNAKDTIEAYAKGVLKNAEIDLLIFEQEACGAADVAKKYGIKTIQIKRNDYKDIFIYQKRLVAELQKRKIEYIFMLNYKYLIRKEMLVAFPNRIINIHPSLFPSFLGTKTAIQDALAYGVKITGITTHIIDEQFDKGIIIMQEAIKIEEDDNYDTLYSKFAEKGKSIVLETIDVLEQKQP